MVYHPYMADIDKSGYIDTVQQNVFLQDYSSQPVLDGVQIIQMKSFPSDEGDFAEVIRFTDNGEFEHVPGFKIAQMNRTRLFPGSVKAWHMHQNQDEIWYVPPYFQLFMGLWDTRKDTPTANKTMRLNLGAGRSMMVYIPRGVAHGSANFSTDAVGLFYFVNQKFNMDNPDELRLHWDVIGADFWKPERD
jgi:dTDP-4-dehydrorhamnose 3,5-epimerase